MNVKIILYIVFTPIVLYTLEGVRINNIFKQNRIIQATLFYMIVTLSLTYLLVNFLYDFFIYTKIGGIL